MWFPGFSLQDIDTCQRLARVPVEDFSFSVPPVSALLRREEKQEYYDKPD
jgi:hypothetical protein